MTELYQSRSTTVFTDAHENEEIYVHEADGEIYLMANGPYEQHIMFEITPADLVRMATALLDIGRRLQE